ncbi:ATP adenylyltransferase domain-containing protein [Chloropicon primus]|uniref:Uncharacterized protein n=2 Tax=Chloropicon primus TaxID=1764295 RepID=A0A5B8MM46_9CHLO|nr:hypothetical protein A3770_04p29500 [Chloropicon primus]UPQ99641.1 ATP adenylyltransferase domain-containing protein [Chloropicon primus]|eukprot:QDZ20432.1 hypothetical protein A3770_04p29500 [Chloropicon primus]
MSLLASVERAVERARSAGALRFLPTKPVNHGRFILRVAESLRSKPKPKLERKPGGDQDPFDRKSLEKELVVCDLEGSGDDGGHTVLLNKFPVVDNHLLVVTQRFEPQDALRRVDYKAVFQVLSAFGEREGLAFYNCGPHSGMSQPHKHVQVVPLPSSIFKEEIEEAIGARDGGLCPVDGLPFACFACAVDLGTKSVEDVGSELERMYEEAKERIEFDSYNLLFTQKWWLLVPRSRDGFGPIGINAMGYAGTFLLRTQEEVDFVTGQEDPMSILTSTGFETQ